MGEATHAFRRLVSNVERVIAGNTEAVTTAAVCLLADGNLLLEGVPGVGKTTLAERWRVRSAASSRASSHNPTCSPATSPHSVYDQANGEFRSCRAVVSPTSCWSMRSTAPRLEPNPRCWSP